VPPDWIARAARSERLAAHAGFWWGCAEGVFFFIVPDVYISFATLFSLRAGATAWAWSIGGSVTAVCVIYLLSAGLVDYVAFLESVPGISSALIADVRGRLATAGLPVTPWLVLEGVPLKVYGGLGFGLGMSLGQVLTWRCAGGSRPGPAPRSPCSCWAGRCATPSISCA
jgi:hypothetical protein